MTQLTKHFTDNSCKVISAENNRQYFGGSNYINRAEIFKEKAEVLAERVEKRLDKGPPTASKFMTKRQASLHQSKVELWHQNSDTLERRLDIWKAQADDVEYSLTFEEKKKLSESRDGNFKPPPSKKFKPRQLSPDGIPDFDLALQRPAISSTPKSILKNRDAIPVLNFEALTETEKQKMQKRHRRLTFAGLEHSVVQEKSTIINDTQTNNHEKTFQNIVVNTSSVALVGSTVNVADSTFFHDDSNNSMEEQPTLARFFIEAEKCNQDLNEAELKRRHEMAAELEKEVDFANLQQDFKARVQEQIATERNETTTTNHARRRANYCQMRELDDEKIAMITSTVLDPDGEPDIQDLLITVIKKDRVTNPNTGKQHSVDIFVKQIPGKSWSECSDEELAIIAKTDITAAEVLQQLGEPENCLPIFFVEYPLPGPELKTIKTFGIVDFDGNVKIMDVRRQGFGTGQYPCQFVTTALTSLRGGLSANQANQARVAVLDDVSNWISDFDYVFGQILQPERFAGSQKQMQNLMNKIIEASDEKTYEQVVKMISTTLCFDTKGIQLHKSKKDKSKDTKEVLTLLAAGKLDKDDIPLAATATLRDIDGSEKSAEAIAGTIRAVFEQMIPDEGKRRDVYAKVKALCFDTTTTNTGWMRGCCEILQHILEKCVLQLACRNHTADTAGKHGWFSQNYFI